MIQNKDKILGYGLGAMALLTAFASGAASEVLRARPDDGGYLFLTIFNGTISLLYAAGSRYTFIRAGKPPEPGAN